MICCVCNRDRPNCVTLTLTDEEKTYIKSVSGEEAVSFVYCKPCLTVLSDKRQGAELMKGFLQISLAAQGVVDAKAKADAYYKLLIDGAVSK